MHLERRGHLGRIRLLINIRLVFRGMMHRDDDLVGVSFDLEIDLKLLLLD